METNNFVGLDFESLEKAVLNDHCIITICCRAMCLRIVKVTDGRTERIKGYSENIKLIPALFSANEDYMRENQEKKDIDVYKKGSFEFDSYLDKWICNIGDIQIFREDNLIKAFLNGKQKMIYSAIGKSIKEALGSLNDWISKCDWEYLRKEYRTDFRE